MRTLVIGVVIVLGLSSCRESPPRVHPLVAEAKRCADAELGCPRPIFAVRDLKPALAYYRDRLGFKIDWSYGEPEDFAAVSRSTMQIFLCLQCQGTAGSGWVWVFARDVDRLHAELVDKRATIRMPPTDMPWGMREMHVEDADGNVLRFGSPVGHDD